MDKDWSRTLSTVLSGLRCHLRQDTNASPAEFLFGTTLRFPGEFFLTENFTPDPNFFIEEFRQFMRQSLVPVTHNYKKRAFCFKDLYTCSHVFMRNMTKKLLEWLYTGPYKVSKRPSYRVFDIEVNGASRSVSVELLKPAYMISDNLPEVPPGVDSNGNQPSTGDRPVLKTY